MQSANATLLSRVILCFRKYPLSKCREQMLYYLLELVYALDNPLYPNAKYKCVIYCGHLMLEKRPSFPNAKFKFDFIYWDYIML